MGVFSTPIVENQMEQKTENEMKTVIYRVI